MMYSMGNSTAWNLLRTLVLAGAATAFAIGTASAQMPMPGINISPGDKRPMTSDELEKQKALDDAYKSAIQKIPNKQKTVDPWGNIRSTPAPADTRRAQ